MKFLITTLAILAFSLSVFSQEFGLESFLEKAEKSSKTYVDTFKNLIAEESKTITNFKKNGDVDNFRSIKSNFIVYQSLKNEHFSEFRTVFEYNGKNVSENDEDVVKFFQKLETSENSEEEFKKVKKQSQRFDGKYLVWGMTLGQDFLLSSDVRKIFVYKLLGKEKFNERDVYAIEYNQKDYSSYILVNPTKNEKKPDRGFQYDTFMPSDFQPTNPRLNGKMLLDAETGQMWKNEYEVEIRPQSVAKPIVTNQSSYEYQASKFGILVPKSIVITSFQIFGKPTKSFSFAKLATMKAEYSKFSSLDSEVKDYVVDKKK
jgi:hypothetical protein